MTGTFHPGKITNPHKCIVFRPHDSTAEFITYDLFYTALSRGATFNDSTGNDSVRYKKKEKKEKGEKDEKKKKKALKKNKKGKKEKNQKKKRKTHQKRAMECLIYRKKKNTKKIQKKKGKTRKKGWKKRKEKKRKEKKGEFHRVFC